MDSLSEITSLIPHRPPFLLVDKIVSYTGNTIVTQKKFSGDLDVYKGHYPGNPITPGVILCEAVFQSGALLMGKLQEAQIEAMTKVPVLTRINSAKFKRTVLPGDTAEITINLKELVSNVAFFKGTLRVLGKVAVQVEFACSMVTSSGKNLAS